MVNDTAMAKLSHVDSNSTFVSVFNETSHANVTQNMCVFKELKKDRFVILELASFFNPKNISSNYYS